MFLRAASQFQLLLLYCLPCFRTGQCLLQAQAEQREKDAADLCATVAQEVVKQTKQSLKQEEQIQQLQQVLSPLCTGVSITFHFHSSQTLLKPLTDLFSKARSSWGGDSIKEKYKDWAVHKQLLVLYADNMQPKYVTQYGSLHQILFDCDQQRHEMS